jgi:group I intron endonuclease
MAKEKICGIYRIENLINHKSYIGQSVDIYERWQEHRWALKTKQHNNIHLMRSWYKYGEENFSFTIVEKCSKDELNQREIDWITYYNAYYNGYNQTKGGNGCLGKIWTEEEREKVSRSVLQISLSGQVVNRFINIDDAEDKTCIGRRQIWNCANKHYTKYCRDGKAYNHASKTAGGYIWIYEDDYDDFDLSDYTNKTISYPVYQYDLCWNLIKKWPSAESVKKEGYKPTVIRSVCQGRFMTAYGYLWTYEIDDLDEYIVWFKDFFDVKYIGQYTTDGILIKIWNTPKETEQDGFNACSVREILNGKQKIHKGYTFDYIPWRNLVNTNWKGQLNYGKQ